MSNNLVEIVFQNELTAAGLAELRSKYPADVVTDMSVEENFKQARKVRTEMNKLVDAINRRRIDVSAEIKKHGDSLIYEVEKIYSVVVEPFEVEDKRRKEIAAEEKRQRDALLEQERSQINEIAGAVADCIGKPSSYIQDTIEAIDLIDTACFDKELIHEVIEVKQITLKSLTSALSQAIANEAAAEATRVAEAKMAEMRAQMEAMQQQMRQQEASAVQQAAEQPDAEQPESEQVTASPAPLQEAKRDLLAKLDGVFSENIEPLIIAIDKWADDYLIQDDALISLNEILRKFNCFGIDV